VLLLYGINFLLAVPLALAFRSALIAGFGDSMSVESLLKDFDATTFSDFMKFHGPRISSLFREVMWLTLLYMLVNTLTGGGVISSLNEMQPLSKFLENCGRFFTRMLRLFGVLAVVFVLFGVIWFFVVGFIFAMVTSDASFEKPVAVWFFVMVAVFLFPMMLLVMAGDYTKIAVVVDDETKIWKTFWRSLMFVFKNFFSTVALQISLLVVLLIVVVFYWLVEGQIGMTSGIAILASFVVQQASVGFKIWTRVWTFAGELALYNHVSIVQEKLDFVPPEVPALPPAQTIVAAVEEVRPATKRIRKPTRKRVVRRTSGKKTKR
jgi:hypothetical protein